MRFGQMEGESAHFASNHIDGIMGMAYHALDPLNGDVAIEKIFEEGDVDDMFSMCLSNAGGELILGGYDQKYEGSIEWTPITSETYYVVQPTKMEILGTDLQIDNTMWGQTIVDSGTTLLILADQVYQKMVDYIINQVCPTFPAQFQSTCQQPNIYSGSFCWKGAESIKYYPNISFTFDGTKALTLTPEDYFLSYEAQGQSISCFGISSAPGLSIFGDVFMQAFETVFDRKGKRVGFAPLQGCSETAAKMSGNGTSQTIEAQHAVSNPLEIQVVYEDGSPAVGLIVEFSIKNGDADLQNSRRLTNSEGKCNTTVVVYEKNNTITATLYQTSQTVDFQIAAPNARSRSKPFPTQNIIFIVVAVAVSFILLMIVVALLIRYRKRRSQDLIYDTTGHDDSESVLLRGDRDFD